MNLQTSWPKAGAKRDEGPTNGATCYVENILLRRTYDGRRRSMTDGPMAPCRSSPATSLYGSRTNGCAGVLSGLMNYYRLLPLQMRTPTRIPPSRRRSCGVNVQGLKGMHRYLEEQCERRGTQIPLYPGTQGRGGAHPVQALPPACIELEQALGHGFMV